MQRRCGNLANSSLVFLADGANWIWDRVGELAHQPRTCILDFYHAVEHLSDLCKELFGEATERYQQHYRKWQTMFWESQLEAVIEELKLMRQANRWRAKRDTIQGQINYFFQKDNPRMTTRATVRWECLSAAGRRSRVVVSTSSPSG